MKFRNQNRTNSPVRGLTLIELLVVISIISILTAMMIPRLRIINKDRYIREAARVAGSVFANASQRAISDGVAGVVIVRNPNLVDAEGVHYGGTLLYTMRAVPPYIGTDSTDVATRTGNRTLTIPVPRSNDVQPLVQVNDYINVNNSSLRYQIINISGSAPSITLTLSLGVGADVLPPLPGTGSVTYPFVVHRQPRRLESSVVELPEGYLIDTRFSGPINPTALSKPLPDVFTSPRCWFHEKLIPNYWESASDPKLQDTLYEQARSIKVIFNGKGAIDRVYFYNPCLDDSYMVGGDFRSRPATSFPNGVIDSRIPLESLYLFIAPLEIEPKSNYGVLDSPDHLWVTVNSNTGGVNIGYNAPIANGQPLQDRINAARGLASNGQNAAQ